MESENENTSNLDLKPKLSDTNIDLEDDVADEQNDSETPIDDIDVIRANVKTNGDFNTVAVGSTIGSIVNISREINETLFPCLTEDCNAIIDLSNYGKTSCPECGRSYFRRNPNLQVTEFKTLDEKETKEFKKVISHVNNKLRDKNYEEAYKYSLEAEKIAPAESTTWEYFALTEFLFEIRKKGKRKKTSDIITDVKNHLEKCKDYSIDVSRYEETSGDIANRLFNLEKSRVSSIVQRNGSDKWLLNDLRRCSIHLKSFELCFSLYKDVRYLEEYVKELCKPYKWLVKDSEGNIKNLVSFDDFVPAKKVKYLVSRIMELKPDYQMPNIELERFEIIKTSTSPTQSTSQFQILSRTKK